MNFSSESAFGFSAGSSSSSPPIVNGDNGLSKSLTEPVTLVLGNGFTDPAATSHFLNDRFIPLNGFKFELIGSTEGQVEIRDSAISVFNYLTFQSIFLSVVSANQATFLQIRDPVFLDASLQLDTGTSSIRLENFHNIFILSNGSQNPAQTVFIFNPATQLFKVANPGVGFNGAAFQVGGALTGGVLIHDQATDATVNNNSDLGVLFTVEGSSGGITFNLPAAAANLRYKFLNTNGNGLTLQAMVTDTIQFDTTVSIAGGVASTNAQGAYVEIVSSGSGKWFGVGIVGVWSVV